MDPIIRTAQEFGAAIRGERRRQHLTQRELALAVGAGERFIVELEAGKESVRIGKALAVAAALGLTLSLGRRS